ncbi:MAG: RNA polymerase sigma factor [Thiohalomonadales bacterium]
MKHKHKQKALEHQLITDMIAKDESAYVIVVREQHQAMKRMARAIVGDAHADDVVQDAWIKITRGIKNFKGQSSLRTWLLAIVGNVAKTRLKKEKRSVAMAEIDGWHDPSGKYTQFNDKGNGCGACTPNKWHMNTPEEIHSSEELKAFISLGLQSLPSSQRTALILREIEGLRLAEVGEIMGKSAGNVRVLVHRARTRMTQIIDLYQQGKQLRVARQAEFVTPFMREVLDFKFS